MRNIGKVRTYSVTRLNVIWGIFIFAYIAVCFRLFYLQVIQHDKFLNQANASQIKSLEIEAQRGTIYAYNDDRKVPLVINQQRWTMFSDTKFIEDIDGLVASLGDLEINLTEQQLEALRSDSRYVVLKKQVTDQEKEEIERQLTYRGVYFQKQNIRQYLEGDLASHVLGFLNDDSQGQYGVEQYYNEELTGVPGQLRVTTDVHDTPLLFIEDNIFIDPQDGQDIVLTLDVALQSIVEEQLQQGIDAVDAKSGSAIVMNANTGAILAMANYPDFDPANFKEASLADYVNPSVEGTLEPASTMKVLLMAAALNEGVVDVDQQYYNPRTQIVDGFAIGNLVDQREGYLPVTEILAKSLNTGTIEMLKRLGGTEDGLNTELDRSDREVLYKYYTENFKLQQATGIDLPNEVSGQLRPPDYPWTPNHLYSTMTFGQSLSVTPIQLATTYSALFNGGSYYQPYITERVGDMVRQPLLIDRQIANPESLMKLEELMGSISEGYLFADVQYPGLSVSAKTGSAQVVDFENGGYIEDVADGLMAGYIKSEQETFVVIVVVKQPDVVFAGSQGAGPIWKEIVKNIISLGRIH